ncbi:MAG: cytochrome c biogenesis protein CcdA [Deltaproteobacteria bacterium]|nr:MAG: cytochrome c biogenesis protein CcdA [Deltaproteobacteria bacterium]
MIYDVPIYMAFTAGLISFLSPCVLPLVPGYLSFISGVSLEELRESNNGKKLFGSDKSLVLINALLFTGGFSLVFILLGASATWLGSFLAAKLSLFTKISGLVIILFGLIKTGLIRFQFLYKEARFNIRNKKYGAVGALLIGASFGFGWTPCIGPILGGILAYAGTLEKVNQGVLLLLVYSLGMGIPFLLTAIGINKFLTLFKKIKRHLGILEIGTGIVLIALGLMIFTNKLILIPGYFSFLNKFAL